MILIVSESLKTVLTIAAFVLGIIAFGAALPWGVYTVEKYYNYVECEFHPENVICHTSQEQMSVAASNSSQE